MLTFIRDLMTFLHLFVGTFLHGSSADWLPVVIAHLVVLSVADTLGHFAAVVLEFRLVAKVFVEFFYFAFFY